MNTSFVEMKALTLALTLALSPKDAPEYWREGRRMK